MNNPMLTLLIALMMTLASKAGAESSSEISKLMNCPGSMLDWGMFMLERDLGDRLEVFYSFDESTVYITDCVLVWTAQQQLKELNDD